MRIRQSPSLRISALCVAFLLQICATTSLGVEVEASNITIKKFKYRPNYKNFILSAKARALYRSRLLVKGEMLSPDGYSAIDLGSSPIRISVGDFMQMLDPSDMRGQPGSPRSYRSNAVNSLSKVVLTPTSSGVRFAISASRLRTVDPKYFTIQLGDVFAQYNLVEDQMQSPAVSVIVGDVVDASTGEGVRRAKVRTQCPEGTCSDITINGRFRIASDPGDRNLIVDGSAALDGVRARFVRSITVAPGTNDVGILALPRLDLESAVAIHDGAQPFAFTISTAPGSSGTATVSVVGGTVVSLPDDLPSPQPLSLTVVPLGDLPAPMPEEVWGPLVFSLQPADIEVSPCADLSMENPFLGLSDGAQVDIYGYLPEDGSFSPIATGVVGGGGNSIEAAAAICRGGWYFAACSAASTSITGMVQQGKEQLSGISVFAFGETVKTFRRRDVDGDGLAENFHLPRIPIGCGDAEVSISALARGGGPGIGMRSDATPVNGVIDGISHLGAIELKVHTCGQQASEWSPLMMMPDDFAFDADDNIYVSNRGRHQVRKLAPDGTPILDWGGEGTAPGKFDSGPQAIAVGANGIVHVADIPPRVQRFDLDGNRVGSLPGFGYGQNQLSAPKRMAADAHGTLYVVDGSADNPTPPVRKFNAAGSFTGEWGERGTGPGQIWRANGLAVGSDLTVYVSDAENRVQQFAPDGTLLRTLDGANHPSESIVKISAIAVDGAGSVYVGDQYTADDGAGPRNFAFIKKYDSNFEFVRKWGGIIGSGEGQLTSTRQIRIDSHGNVAVLAQGSKRILFFDPDGNLRAEVGTFSGGPRSLGVDPAGYVRVRDSATARGVLTFDPDGNLLGRWDAPGRSPLVVDWDGNIYLFDDCTLMKYDRTLELVATGSPPPGVLDDCNVQHLDADNHGHVYVFERNRSEIWKFSDQGEFLNAWNGQGEHGGEFASVPTVRSVAADARGFVYLAEGGQSFGHRIRKFESNGTLVAMWNKEDVGSAKFPAGRFILDADPHGNLYVADAQSSLSECKIFVYDPDGAYLGDWRVRTFLPGAPTVPSTINVDGVGNVYVIDNNSRIVRYSCPD